VEHAESFADLTLDDEFLHTPVGPMPLGEITRAEFVRDVVSHGTAPGTQETSVPAVVGTAAVGGVIFGAAGAVVGGLLGSTVKEDVPGHPYVHTNSVTIVFETDSIVYSMDISRDQEMNAHRFTQAVRKAVKHHT